MRRCWTLYRSGSPAARRPRPMRSFPAWMFTASPTTLEEGTAATDVSALFVFIPWLFAFLAFRACFKTPQTARQPRPEGDNAPINAVVALPLASRPKEIFSRRCTRMDADDAVGRDRSGERSAEGKCLYPSLQPATRLRYDPLGTICVHPRASAAQFLDGANADGAKTGPRRRKDVTAGAGQKRDRCPAPRPRCPDRTG